MKSQDTCNKMLGIKSARNTGHPAYTYAYNEFEEATQEFN